MNVSTENTSKGEVADNKLNEEPKILYLSKVETEHIDPETVNGNSIPTKKRKLHASECDGRGKSGSDTPGEAGNGEVIQAERWNAGETERSSKKAKNNVVKEDKVTECLPTGSKEDSAKKIKWKKLIKSALKSVCIINNIYFLFFHLIIM